MDFCKFSSQYIIGSSTTIENVFFSEYLPFAQDTCVKVFLYGLYKCTNSSSPDNTLEHFSKVLNISTEDIESAFLYWQEQGLVQIINTEPFAVRYLPIKENLGNLKKFKKEKYSSFNIQIQELIIGRMITPTEYAEYYTLLETFGMEPEALLMIVKYITGIKGANIGYRYIITVATNWAYEGILTTQSVEDKILEHGRYDDSVLQILKTLGLRRRASIEEYSLFLKWTKDFGFLPLDIQQVAKTLNKKGGFFKLDNLLSRAYEMKLLSFEEIDAFEKEKNNMFSLAKDITKAIGVYYQDLSNVVETYIVEWLKKGYSNDTLVTLANYCFKNNLRTLEGMNLVILKFFKLGLVTQEAINQYTSEILEIDSQIKKLLEACGLARRVNNWDRDAFKIWSNAWGFDFDVILYAASLAAGKSNPIAYINKVLSLWHQNKIKTVEAAKNTTPPATSYTPSTTTISSGHNFTGRSYSDEELNALFDNLDEVDI